MGENLCKSYSSSQLKLSNQKFYQVNHFYNRNNPSLNSEREKESEKTMQSLQSQSTQNNEIEVLILDAERDKIITNKIEPRVIQNLRGLSELNYGNSLYLIGTREEEEETGAYNFKITNIKADQTKFEILISSQFNHVSPSLVYIGNETILVVGGKNQKACESYDIEFSRWDALPELSEERFHCTLVLDGYKKYVYLFGGFCKDKDKICGSIMRMDINKQLQWEQIAVKNKDTYSLINKSSCAGFTIEGNDFIYLLGGKNSEGNETDQIIKYDPVTNKAVSLSMKLKEPSKFINQTGLLFSDTYFVFFNNKNNIEKIFKRDIQILGFQEHL